MFLSSSILNHPVSKTKTNTVEVKFSTILLSFSLNWLSLLQYLALPSSSPPSVWLLWTEPQVGLHWRSEWDRQILAFLGTFYLNLCRFVRSCSPQHCLSLNLLPVWSHSWPGRLQGSLLLSRKKHSYLTMNKAKCSGYKDRILVCSKYKNSEMCVDWIFNTRPNNNKSK